MKLSKYVKHLQGVLKNEGDLEVVQSDVDDDMEIEFYKKEYGGCILYFEDLDGHYIKQIDVEDLEDYESYERAYCIN